MSSVKRRLRAADPLHRLPPVARPAPALPDPVDAVIVYPARVPLWRRIPRAAIVGLGVAVLALTVVGVLPRLTSEPQQTPQAPNTSPRSAAGSDSGGRPDPAAIANRQADPARKGPDWAATVFAAANGQTCIAAGRLVDGRVGTYAPDGSFRAYPTEDGGSCADLESVPAGAQVTMSTGKDARTVVAGIAGPKVTSINLTASGRSSELELGPRGSFLAVLDAARTGLRDVQVTAHLRDGSTYELFTTNR